MFPSRLAHASWFVTRPRLYYTSLFFKNARYSSSHLLSFTFMVCTTRSTSPLDCAYSGDDVTCSNPHRAANSLNFFGCKLKAVVSDKGIAYTMSTKHFLHSQDGLSSIDTSRYKTDFNVAWVPQAANCDLYGRRSLLQLFPMVNFEKVYSSRARSFLPETSRTCRSSAASSRCHVKVHTTRRKRLYFHVSLKYFGGHRVDNWGRSVWGFLGWLILSLLPLRSKSSWLLRLPLSFRYFPTGPHSFRLSVGHPSWTYCITTFKVSFFFNSRLISSKRWSEAGNVTMTA